MPSPRNILLVGVDRNLGRDLGQQAGVRRSDWQFVHARGFLEALALLAARPCEAVIASLALPGFSGGQLMMEVMHRHPRTRRILIAEARRLPASPKCSGAAHQVWLEPINAEALMDRLSMALARETWFADETAQRLFARLMAMPPLPEVYFQIEEARQHGIIPVEEFTRILAGFREAQQHWERWIATAPVNWADSIPSEQIALVLLAHLRAFFGLTLPRPAALAEWESGARMTARLAREIARAETRAENLVRDAFLGGLLHDAGRFLLEINYPERMTTVRRLSQQKLVPLCEAERTVFGTTHADLGACLLSQWGLPWPVVEAVARHHDPAPSGPAEFSAAAAVQAAVKSTEEWQATAAAERPHAPLLAPGTQHLETVSRSDFAVHPRAA